MTPAQFTGTATFFRIGNEPIAVDILSGIAGVAFDDAWKRRVTAVIDARIGLTAPFISSEDLVAAKLAAGRPQDLADVAALRDAKGRPKP
ncbi:MAG: hypothetical protein JWP63_5545 [Candidatus Solibacter sp.]|nr:hypothetical protein [Candidatus Solibacter sp.]